MSLLGTAAPDFNLVNHANEWVTLSGLRGQKVILAFYPAAFTGVCSKEMCTFQDSLAELNAANAAVFGISVDARFSNAAFASQNGLEFQLLSDYTRSTVNAYGVALENFGGMEGYVASHRAVFVVNEEGNVIYEWVGANPGIEPNYDEVKAVVA